MAQDKAVPIGKRRREGRRAAPVMPDQAITRGMLTNLVRPSGRSYAIAAPSMDANEVAIHGRVDNYRFHSGLRVHATDTLEAHDLATQTQIAPELTAVVFLEGTVGMELDGDAFDLGSSLGPTGYLWSIGKPSQCRRLSRKGTRIRKVLVSAPHSWFGRFTDDDEVEARNLHKFVSKHGSLQAWEPSNRILALCEQILSPPTSPGIVHRLGVESKAIEIFATALASLGGAQHSEDSPEATMRHITRARTVRQFLIDHVDENIELPAIAKAVGMSVESMQRAFKSAYGTTVVDFVREYRLHQARRAICQEGISVSEAAYRAGYTSPANFSTAFKKLFGLTPSEAAK